jgi:UDP:flavonoid glycosyltransferase YjiC (YdhE family)
MKRALFFPFPGNYGPIVNCHSIAEHLVRLGYQVGFSATGYYDSLIESDKYLKIPTLPPSWVGKSKSSLKNRPFSQIGGIDSFASFFGFNDFGWLKAYIDNQINVVKEFSPDVLIGSWDFVLGITGELLGIPVVNIYQTGMHPSSSGFEWWQGDLPNSCPQTNLPVFNKLLKLLGLQEAACLEEVISKADLLILPSIPELDPLPETESRARYVGYMSPNLHLDQEDPSDFISAHELTDVDWLYVYEHGIGYGLKTLHTLLKLYTGTTKKIIVSVGMDTNIELFPDPPPNFKYLRYVPQKATALSQVAIIHGAIGSIMSCIHYNIPNISVPTTSERKTYSKRLADLKAGVDLDFDTLSVENMRVAIHTATANETRQNLEYLSRKSRALGGARKAAILVDGWVK